MGVSSPRHDIRGIEPGATLLAGFIHADGLPNVAVRAGGLCHACFATEAGKRVAGVFAHKGVGVVFAHIEKLSLSWGAKDAVVWCCRVKE